jgi:hypothetical protein
MTNVTVVTKLSCLATNNTGKVQYAPVEYTEFPQAFLAHWHLDLFTYVFVFFIYGILNDVVGTSNYIASNDMVNGNELERKWNEAVVA